MSDLEHIKRMLESKKISYEVNPEWANVSEGKTMLIVERGYGGFTTEFTFDKAGMFEDIGAYE